MEVMNIAYLVVIKPDFLKIWELFELFQTGETFVTQMDLREILGVLLVLNRED